MNYLPSFETERLRLKPRTWDDFEDCLRMDSDPAVHRYLPGSWEDPDERRQFLEDRLNRNYPEGMGYWSVFPRSAPDQFLGWILLIPLDAVGPEVEIGWRLRRSAWGKGYATEAARPVLGHAFCTLALDRVIAEIDARNTGSASVARKSGMRQVGTKDDGGRIHHVYAVTRREFDEEHSLKK